MNRELETCRSTLLVLPTGTGKTVAFARLAEEWAPRGKTLILAHREELITQAAQKIAHWTKLSCQIEMADARASMDGLYSPDVVVASVQSLARKKRLNRFAEFDFSLVVVDEAHHALATTYREILDYFAFAKVLGVTATPDRGDRGRLSEVFESVAFVYEMRQAIADGFLVDVRQKAIEVTGLDLSKVRTTAGDLNEGDLEKLLRQEEHLHHVAQPVYEMSGERKTLVFAVTVAHAHELAAVINGHHKALTGDSAQVAVALDGTADAETRASTLASFRKGEFRILVNCALFTEGFDLPAISCVAVARPTKSRALYSQMVGRGTRLSPETGKADLLVLDFKGNAGKHSLACPADILGGIDPPVRKRVDELLKANPGMAIGDAAKLAETEIAERKRKLEEAERKRRERVGVAVGVRKSVREVDPFDTIGVPRPVASQAGSPPTDRQIAILNGLGFPAMQQAWSLTSESASRLIETLSERKKAGQSSFKMARLLKRNGFDPNMPKGDAKRVMAALAKNGWRPLSPGQRARLLAPPVASAPVVVAAGGEVEI